MISRVTETKSPVSGASTKETVKPSRGKCRVFRCTCGDFACVLLLPAREAAGALVRPAFPAPSFQRGTSFAEPGPRNRAAGRKGCACEASLPLSFRVRADARLGMTQVVV